MRVPAQAKINLFLRVLAREASGYHQLETLFARLDLADDVVVRRTSSERSLDVTGAELPADGLGPVERNLAWRAAVAFADAAGWVGGFAIALEKRVPTGGGLGGGSADAGAVLRAMNALHGAPLPVHRLLALAAVLGADVPVLTVEAPLALAWGRGERMLAFPALPGRDVALVLPGFGISTPEAFAWLAEARAAGADDDGAIESDVRPRVLFPHQFLTWDAVARLGGNDFERPVRARHPLLGTAREALASRGAQVARMTGTGSTVFGIFDRAPDATLLSADIGARVVLTRTAERVAPVEVLHGA